MFVLIQVLTSVLHLKFESIEYGVMKTATERIDEIDGEIAGCRRRLDVSGSPPSEIVAQAVERKLYAIQETLSVLADEADDLDSLGDRDAAKRRVSASESRRRACALLAREYRDMLRISTAKKRNETRNALLRGGNDAATMKERRERLGARSDVEERLNMKESLTRTRAMMAAELERMERVDEILDADRNTLKDVTTEYGGAYDASVGESAKLLRAMKAQEKMERYAVYASMCIFALVCTYILYRRFGVLLAPAEFVVGKAFQFATRSIEQIDPQRRGIENDGDATVPKRVVDDQVLPADPPTNDASCDFTPRKASSWCEDDCDAGCTNRPEKAAFVDDEVADDDGTHLITNDDNVSLQDAPPADLEDAATQDPSDAATN